MGTTVPKSAGMFDHLIELANLHVPLLEARPDISPPEGLTDAQYEALRDDQRFAMAVDKMSVYARELPYTQTQMKTILRNMALEEAILAPKASDRLAALTLVGKSSDVDYFAADKVVVTRNQDELRDAVLEKMEKLFGGTMIEGEVVRETRSE